MIIDQRLIELLRSVPATVDVHGGAVAVNVPVTAAADLAVMPPGTRYRPTASEEEFTRSGGGWCRSGGVEEEAAPPALPGVAVLPTQAALAASAIVLADQLRASCAVIDALDPHGTWSATESEQVHETTLQQIGAVVDLATAADEVYKAAFGLREQVLVAVHRVGLPVGRVAAAAGISSTRLHAIWRKYRTAT